MEKIKKALDEKGEVLVPVAFAVVGLISGLIYIAVTVLTGAWE